MRTPVTFVLFGLCAAIGCERAPDPVPHAAPSAVTRVKPAVPIEVPVPPAPTPVKPTIIRRPAISLAPEPQPTTVPSTPSDGPKAYAAWLRGQTPAERKRIAALCRAQPDDYQAECGGIGPLHIPVPPHLVLPMADPHPDRQPRSRSRFASMEDWHAALSPAQRQYVARECSLGENQPSSDLCGLNTPLVVAFDGQPISFARGGTFAFAPGLPVATDLPAATTPWIALDRNHDGIIDSGAELFGSNTALAGGGTAPNGFVALAALDTNHDGRIDAADADFASLVLWADRDGDGRSSPGELTALSTVIVSISLASHVELTCDARSNCEGERATFSWRDPSGGAHEGSVVDVYLPRR